MTVLHWLNQGGVFTGVLVMWIGSLPVTSGIGWLIHRAERRHREQLAATERLTAALTRPKED